MISHGHGPSCRSDVCLYLKFDEDDTTYTFIYLYTIYCNTDRFTHIIYDDDGNNNIISVPIRIAYRFFFFF